MYNIEQASPTTTTNSWYTNVYQYLEHVTVPSHFSAWQKSALRLKVLYYQLMHGVLFRNNHNIVLLMCLEAHDSEKVLHDIHDRPSRGHFRGNTTSHKVMWAGFYWPTLFIDTHAYACKCLVCQKCANRNKKSAIPLQPIPVEEQFQ